MWIDKSEDEFTNQAQKQASVGQGGGSVPGSNTAQGNPSTISPITPQQPQQQPASIQDYLKANTNQANDLGQKVTSSLSDSQNQEKSTIDQSADSVKNDINSNSVNYDPNLVNKAISDPTAINNNDNDLNSFLKQWNASYSGPQNFESTDKYNTAAGAANEANQKAQQLQTAGGREQLIGDQFGVYGQGNKGLDQALLETSSAFPAIQQQGNQFGSIQDYLANKSKDLNTAAQQAQTNTTQTKNITQDTFNAGVKNLGDKLAGEQAQIQSTGGQAINSPVDNLLSLLPANPTDVDLGLKGLTRDQYNAILATSGHQTTDPNASNSLYAANPQYSKDLAQYLAAQQLQKKALNA